MDEGFVKFVGIAIAIGLLAYGVFYFITNHSGIIFIALFVIAIAIGVFFFVMQLKQQATTAAISKDVPEGSPMKVNLEVQQISSRLHRLHINVKMSRSDWLAIEHAGLGQLSLFEHQGVTKLDNFYGVGHLLRVRHVDFETMQDLEHAKDEFIQGMHALRTRIDSQKELQRSPQARTESFEV